MVRDVRYAEGAAARLTGAMPHRLLRSPLAWLAIGALGVGAAFGLYWFQPWKLVTDEVVDEAVPVAQAPAPQTTEPDTDPADPGPEYVFAGGYFVGTDYQLLEVDGTVLLSFREGATFKRPTHHGEAEGEGDAPWWVLAGGAAGCVDVLEERRSEEAARAKKRERRASELRETPRTGD